MLPLVESFLPSNETFVSAPSSASVDAFSTVTAEVLSIVPPVSAYLVSFPIDNLPPVEFRTDLFSD